jgi:hypothetical protein
MASKAMRKAMLEHQNQQVAKNQLLSILAGDVLPKVYTLGRHVSTSGMSRDISLYVVRNNELFNITYYASVALGWKLVERNGSRAIRVTGAGMDMGFHTVYTLSSVLYRGTVEEGDAGYKLSQEWM